MCTPTDLSTQYDSYLYANFAEERAHSKTFSTERALRSLAIISLFFSIFQLVTTAVAAEL